MDVRCDRCQTEYELDDESIGGSGASVQCTTCGHTFVVSRQGSVRIGTPPGGLGSAETPAPVPRVSQPMAQAPASVPVSAPPAVPEWVLATEEGQTHRLRDLTTLQKWVVERRVTRGDRVSHRGGAWRALGELEELRPFFDVVDQADRHTGAPPVAEAARAVRATMPATPRVVGSQSRHSPLEPDEGDLTARARRSRAPEPFLEASIADAPDDEDLSMALKPRRTGLKVFGALLFMGAAAGAAWFMFKDPHAFHLKSGTPVPASAPTASSAAAAAPGAAPTPPPPPPPPAAAEPPAPKPAAEAQAPDPKPATEAKPEAEVTPAAKAGEAEAKGAEAKLDAAKLGAAKPTGPKPAAESKSDAKVGETKAASEAKVEAKPRSYEQLVAEGDRALENGQSAKAQKLYDEALRQQPNGVAAMTGSAYVLLDRHRSLAAIGVFKQVLSNAPHYAPALFGLGEAYRSQGETPHALEAYKNYLEQSPTGSDAPAARRQIKELGEAAAPPRNPGPSATIPEGAGSSSPSPTAPPPATAP
jgi:predicted Zn finger-like uncharacterized protein